MMDSIDLSPFRVSYRNNSREKLNHKKAIKIVNGSVDMTKTMPNKMYFKPVTPSITGPANFTIKNMRHVNRNNKTGN
jgi:hypothetical protein